MTVHSPHAYNQAGAVRESGARISYRSCLCRCGRCADSATIARLYPKRHVACPDLSFDLFLCDFCSRGQVVCVVGTARLRAEVAEAIQRYGLPQQEERQ